jgi:cytochrome c-type biogenesis protein CcmH/NrfG
MNDVDPLEEERGFLLRSLDDLDREVAAGDLDAADADALRADYAHRLAEVQRSIEQVDPAPAEARRTRAGWGRRIVAGVIVVGIAGGSGLGVANWMGERRPGDTITGDTPASTSDLLDQAATYTNGGKVLDAIKTYDDVLARQPGNAIALAERGFLLLIAAQQAGGDAALVEQGKRSVELALRSAPNDPRFLFYLGVARFFEDDAAGANAAFDSAIANRAPADIVAAIQDFRARAAATTTTAAPR